ncbi:hypothetical protein [Clostridium tarantellae]|uniref:Uncharacterized protein n=1 Tax=Clostridium tarantellae TaxID=39493 RepID=A0A6I1MM75_9CLOT|nr:hypothetical protein [Clostridium tarantellae]MPQ43342.1 hypothetical protein [Clostridium tarantellae]
MDEYKKDNVVIILALISIGLFLYYIHYLIFSNLYGTVSSIFFAVAFTPVQIILNILVIDKTVDQKEKIQHDKKINILVGTFFSEFGTDFLTDLVKGDDNIQKILPDNMVSKCLREECFENLKQLASSYEYVLNIEKINLVEIKEKLYNKNEFLIDLMTNAEVKEDQSFTDLLISLIHLNDEIKARYNDGKLEKYEIIHILYDMRIVYKKLTIEWINYMIKLKGTYKQLFVRAMITSPFDNRSKKEKDEEFLQLK